MLYLLFSLFRRIFLFCNILSALPKLQWLTEPSAIRGQPWKLKLQLPFLSAGPSILLVEIYKAPGQSYAEFGHEQKSSHFGKWSFSCSAFASCLTFQELIWKYSKNVSPIVLLFIWASGGFAAAAAVLANEPVLTHRAAFHIITCWKVSLFSCCTGPRWRQTCYYMRSTPTRDLLTLFLWHFHVNMCAVSCL